MSSEYDRPDRDTAADPCAYTDYDTEADYAEKESVEGEVPKTGAGAEGLERRVWEALYGIEDPEMPISIVDLGLIYGVDADEGDGSVEVEMTLTYTGCPARDMLINEVTRTVAAVEGVADAGVVLVWSPGWTVDMVTEQGKESLREFGLSV